MTLTRRQTLTGLIALGVAGLGISGKLAYDALTAKPQPVEVKKNEVSSYSKGLKIPEQYRKEPPEIEAIDLNGQPFSLRALRGKPVLLDFWATGCRPCVGEIPNIEQVREKYKELVVVGISVDTDREILKQFLKEKNITYTQIWDPEEKIAKTYNVHGIPQIKLIDREGRTYAYDLRGQGIEKFVNELFESK